MVPGLFEDVVKYRQLFTTTVSANLNQVYQSFCLTSPPQLLPRIYKSCLMPLSPEPFTLNVIFIAKDLRDGLEYIPQSTSGY